MMRIRNAMALFVLTVAVTGLLAACGDDSETEQRIADLEGDVSGLQAQVQQLTSQLESTQTEATQVAATFEERLAEPQVGPVIGVAPAIFKFPDSRVRSAGDIWFYGSGLEPGQWFRLTVEGEGELGEFMDFTDPLARQADEDGAFAVTLDGIRPERFVLSEPVVQEGGKFTLRLWDMDTNELVASTPWLICGSNGENPWCVAAEGSAIVEGAVEEEVEEE